MRTRLRAGLDMLLPKHRADNARHAREDDDTGHAEDHGEERDSPTRVLHRNDVQLGHGPSNAEAIPLYRAVALELNGQRYVEQTRADEVQRGAVCRVYLTPLRRENKASIGLPHHIKLRMDIVVQDQRRFFIVAAPYHQSAQNFGLRSDRDHHDAT